jgi:hypothetical protein
VDDLLTGQFNNPVRVIPLIPARADQMMFRRMWPDNCLSERRKKISRSARQPVLSNFVSAKRKYCALRSQTKPRVPVIGPMNVRVVVLKRPQPRRFHSYKLRSATGALCLSGRAGRLCNLTVQR